MTKLILWRPFFRNFAWQTPGEGPAQRVEQGFVVILRRKVCGGYRRACGTAVIGGMRQGQKLVIPAEKGKSC